MRWARGYLLAVALLGVMGATARGDAPSGPYENMPILRTGGSGAGAGGDGSASLGAVRVTLALAAVVGLIFALRWGMRRWSGVAAAGPEAIEIISRTAVTPRQQLLLIHVGRRIVLASNNGAQMSALCEIHDPDEVAELLGRTQAQQPGSMTQSLRAMLSGPTQETESADGMDPAAVSTRLELSGLRDKVRRLALQLPH